MKSANSYSWFSSVQLQNQGIMIFFNENAKTNSKCMKRWRGIYVSSSKVGGEWSVTQPWFSLLIFMTSKDEKRIEMVILILPTGTQLDPTQVG